MKDLKKILVNSLFSIFIISIFYTLVWFVWGFILWDLPPVDSLMPYLRLSIPLGVGFGVWLWFYYK